MKPSKTFLVYVFSFLYSIKLWGGGPQYGVFNFFPQGSTRVLAMGGAFTGLSDDASAIVHNPAGLAKSKNWFTFLSTSNYTNDSWPLKADPNWAPINDSRDDSYSFNFSALSLKIGSIAIAIGQGQPYQTPMTYYSPVGMRTINYNLNITNKHLVVAAALNQSLSIGLDLIEEKLFEQYDVNQFGNTHYEESSTQRYIKTGISFWPGSNYGFGAQYQAGQQYNISTKYNSLLDEAWFNSGYIPSHYVLGGFFKTNSKVTFVLDYDVFILNRDMQLAGSDLFLKSPILFKKGNISILHGGLEWHCIENINSDFYIRGGMYKEPARFQNFDNGQENVSFSDREHNIWGLEWRYYVFDMGLSEDTAPNFTNFSFDLGIRIFN